MSLADFRHIGGNGTVPKQERLFRAAVSAFCALIRPGRRDVIQLEELTLPLFEVQSRESKRFAAAALSEAADSSNALIRLLCDESVDVAAPLLIRSPALSDIDLIALIGRHGLPHATAIGRRTSLHPTIAALARALAQRANDIEDIQPNEAPMPNHFNAPRETTLAPTQNSGAAQNGQSPSPAAAAAAERMRDRLRGFMAPAESNSAPSRIAADGKAKVFARLKMTALTGNAAFFQTALSDALEIELAAAQEITSNHGYNSLIAALKVLDLSDEQAFMIAAAVFPSRFTYTETVRLFVERYQVMQKEAAMDLVRGWQMEAATRRLVRWPVPVNSDAPDSTNDSVTRRSVG